MPASAHSYGSPGCGYGHRAAIQPQCFRRLSRVRCSDSSDRTRTGRSSQRARVCRGSVRPRKPSQRANQYADDGAASDICEVHQPIFGVVDHIPSVHALGCRHRKDSAARHGADRSANSSSSAPTGSCRHGRLARPQRRACRYWGLSQHSHRCWDRSLCARRGGEQREAAPEPMTAHRIPYVSSHAVAKPHSDQITVLPKPEHFHRRFVSFSDR